MLDFGTYSHSAFSAPSNKLQSALCREFSQLLEFILSFKLQTVSWQTISVWNVVIDILSFLCKSRSGTFERYLIIDVSSVLYAVVAGLTTSSYICIIMDFTFLGRSKQLSISVGHSKMILVRGRIRNYNCLGTSGNNSTSS